jgi:hypothetical protein
MERAPADEANAELTGRSTAVDVQVAPDVAAPEHGFRSGPPKPCLTSRLIHVLFLFMSSAAEWKERRDAALQELAELGMALARDLAGRAKAAKTTDEAERCAGAFDRLSRSVRLTFSIQSRLELEARQARSLDEASFAARASVRRQQVKAAVMRTLRADAPEQEFERLAYALERRVAEGGLYEEFVDGPLAAQIERVREGLGLPPRDGAGLVAFPAPVRAELRPRPRPEPRGPS